MLHLLIPGHHVLILVQRRTGTQIINHIKRFDLSPVRATHVKAFRILEPSHPGRHPFTRGIRITVGIRVFQFSVRCDLGFHGIFHGKHIQVMTFRVNDISTIRRIRSLQPFRFLGSCIRLLSGRIYFHQPIGINVIFETESIHLELQCFLIFFKNQCPHG